MAEPSRHPVRVYYEDTDFSGNVYHAAYLRFLERGRTEWLRERGVHHAALARDGIAFAVHRMEIDFLAAVRIDDELTVETAVTEGGGVRLLLDQTIRRGETLVTRARVVVVAIRMAGGPARLPRGLRERLTS